MFHVYVHQLTKHDVIVNSVHTISNTTTLLAYTKGWSYGKLLRTCCFGHCLIACTCCLLLALASYLIPNQVLVIKVCTCCLCLRG